MVIEKQATWLDDYKKEINLRVTSGGSLIRPIMRHFVLKSITVAFQI